MTTQNQDQNSQQPHGPPPKDPKDAERTYERIRGGYNAGRERTPDDQESIRRHMKHIAKGLSLRHDYDGLLLGRAGASLFDLECAEAKLSKFRASTSRLAQSAWDHLRELEAHELFAALRRNPGVIALKLKHSTQGCQLLIQYWTNLGRALTKQGSWTDPQRRLAWDLLGTPRAVRDAGFTELDAQDGEETPQVNRLRAIVQRELDRLNGWLHSQELVKLDEQQRRDIIDGCAWVYGEEGRLLEKQRAEHARRFQWAITQLKQGRAARERLERQMEATTDQVRRHLAADPEAMRKCGLTLADLLPSPAESSPEPKPAPHGGVPGSGCQAGPDPAA